MVVQQHIAVEVEIFVLHRENILTNQLVQNLENWSTFAKVIIKQQVAYFLRHSGLDICRGWQTLVVDKNRWRSQ